MEPAPREVRTTVGSRHRPAVSLLEILAPFALMGLVAASRDSEHFRTIVGEDGVLEWAQVSAFVVAAWVLCSAAARTAGLTRLVYAGCGAAVVVVVGEELAWGTRLLGSGVGFIEARNEQGDTTLHNLGGVLDLSFLGIAVTALVLAALVALRWEPFRTAPLTVAWWLTVPALYAAYRVGAGEVPYHVAKLSEAAELVFALAVARLAFCARARHAAPAPAFGELTDR